MSDSLEIVLSNQEEVAVRLDLFLLNSLACHSEYSHITRSQIKKMIQEGRVVQDGKEVKKLPMSLGEALAHLEGSEVVRRGMPGEMYRLYHEYKHDEWARFMSTVTDWDKETYMECLP